jgi:hypothetical protein
MTAVGNRSSAVDTAIGTDRKKILQTSALMWVRAMRSVLCEVPPARLTPLSYPQFSRID